MSEVTFDEVSGLAKKVYDSSGVADYQPSCAIITQDAPWTDMARTGESYSMSVVVSPPNGFTYAGSAGGSNALKAARNMVVKQAEITPFELDLREQVTFAALSRLVGENKSSFANLQTTMQKAMKKSAAIRLECAGLRGQRSLGTVEAVTDLGSSQMDITITAATWAPGLWWALGNNATLDSFTSTTKNNGSGPLILKGITRASRKIKVTHSGTYSDQVAVGDTLWFEGAWDGTTFYEMPGAMTQAAHISGVGPVGLNVTTYPSFQGNTYDVAGGFSSEVAEDMAGQLRDRGAEGAVRCYLPNLTYGEIANELKANQAIGISYNPQRQKFGQASFTQESKDVGPIEYVNHPFLQWGEAFMAPEGAFIRGGSSDIVPYLPGTDREKLWRLVEGYTLCETLLFSDQFLLVKAPPHCLVATGITHP
jgi:hypothetical protein